MDEILLTWRFIQRNRSERIKCSAIRPTSTMNFIRLSPIPCYFSANQGCCLKPQLNPKDCRCYRCFYANPWLYYYIRSITSNGKKKQLNLSIKWHVANKASRTPHLVWSPYLVVLIPISCFLPTLWLMCSTCFVPPNKSYPWVFNLLSQSWF